MKLDTDELDDLTNLSDGGSDGIDFNPLYDNKEWNDAPKRQPAEVIEGHKQTKLDRFLKKRSRDGRKAVIILHAVVSALIVLGSVAAVIGLVWFGFSYAFL